MGKSSKKPKVYDYYLSIDYGVCHGPVDSINSVEAKDKVIRAFPVDQNSATGLSKRKLWGGDKKEGGVAGVIEYFLGGWDQRMSGELASRFSLTPNTAPGYRGLCHILFRGGRATGTDPDQTGLSTLQQSLLSTTFDPDGNGTSPVLNLLQQIFTVVTGGGVGVSNKGFLWVTNSPYIPPVTANVTRGAKGLMDDPYIWPITGFEDGAYTFADWSQAFPGADKIDKTKLPDTNPAAIIYECMTNADFGKGELESAMDKSSYLAAAQTLIAENFGLSLRWMKQDKIENFIAEVQDHIKAMHFQHPRTGLWTLKLIRGDYDVDELETLSPANCTLESLKRGQWSDTINQINVSYTSPATEKEEIVSSLNLASISVVAGSRNETRDYHGVRNPWLAKFIANRDLSESSRVLTTASVYGNRSVMDYVPGDVVLLTWPDEGIAAMPMRIMGVKPGNPKDRRVKLELTEDVFSEPSVQGVPDLQSYAGPPIVTVPEDLEFVHIMSPPMPLMVQAGYDPVEIDADYPAATVAFWLSHNPRPDQADAMADVVQPDGTVLKESVAEVPITYAGRLFSNLPQEVVSTLPDAQLYGLSPSALSPGMLFLLGSSELQQEIILLGAYDAVDATWTVYRGIYDTEPLAWPADTPIMNMQSEDEMIDRIERAVGETIAYRFRPITFTGQLDYTDATEYSYTVPDRTYAPFRPANVQVDGNGFAATQYLAGAIPASVTVTWANRNRLGEDIVIQRWDGSNVTPETGQTTTVRFRDSIGGVVEFEPSALTGDSLAVSLTTEVTDYRFYDVEVASVRDGVESWTTVVRELEIERLGYGNNYGYDYGENDG